MPLTRYSHPQRTVKKRALSLLVAVAELALITITGFYIAAPSANGMTDSKSHIEAERNLLIAYSAIPRSGLAISRPAIEMPPAFSHGIAYERTRFQAALCNNAPTAHAADLLVEGDRLLRAGDPDFFEGVQFAGRIINTHFPEVKATKGVQTRASRICSFLNHAK